MKYSFIALLILLISLIFITNTEAGQKVCVEKECRSDCIQISYYDSECRPKGGCYCCWTDEDDERQCTKY